ncbi:hypothetical protein D3C76_1652940 [compost metagenome]
MLSAIHGQEIDAVTRIHQNDMERVAVINGFLHHMAVRCCLAGSEIIAPPLTLCAVMR